MFLLDTNVISETRKNRPHGGVIEFLTACGDDDLLLSAVTVGEIQVGVELTRSQDPQKAAEIEDWLSKTVEYYPILPLDAATFRQWALMMHGKSGSLAMDAMIAATAKVHRLIVVTRNLSDFETFGVPTLNPFTSKEPL